MLPCEGPGGTVMVPKLQYNRSQVMLYQVPGDGVNLVLVLGKSSPDRVENKAKSIVKQKLNYLMS